MKNLFLKMHRAMLVPFVVYVDALTSVDTGLVQLRKMEVHAKKKKFQENEKSSECCAWDHRTEQECPLHWAVDQYFSNNGNNKQNVKRI